MDSFRALGKWRVARGERQRLISQEGGAHSKQLMRWRVKAPQLALMMQSGREEEGPEVQMESAPTYTQGTHIPFLGHSSPLQDTQMSTLHRRMCVDTKALGAYGSKSPTGGTEIGDLGDGGGARLFRYRDSRTRQIRKSWEKAFEQILSESS